MTFLYILLKVSALLAIIIIPLIGPKKKKEAAVKVLSSLAVNERGYLEHNVANNHDHYQNH